MRTFPPKFVFVFAIWLTLTSLSVAQRRYAETPEPPLADPSKTTKQPNKFDPDETSGIEPAQYVVPVRPVVITSPTRLPGSVTNPGPATLGTGRPLTYEAIPTPQVTLHIEGANDAASGQPVAYKIIVTNNSRAKAHNVVVKATPPKDAKQVKVDPKPIEDNAAETKWDLKVLEPGQSRTIDVSYLPNAETVDLKLLARVQFDFGRGMITHVSPPALTIDKQGPTTLVSGESVIYRITVKNTGKVTIRDIEVHEKLDAGLVYDTREMSRGTVDGRLTSQIEKTGDRLWEISGLAPGQTQIIDYRVKADALGVKKSSLYIKYPGSPKEPKHKDFEVEVLSANLKMEVTGPAEQKGIVGQGASYKAIVTNRGNAELRNVTLRCLFPAEMRVMKATQGGQPFREQVQWIFKVLKPGETEEVTIALTTSSPGSRNVQFIAKADKGNEQKAELKTEFIGEPNLKMNTEIPNIGTVGKKMTYTVTVVNNGQGIAKGVQLKMDLPNNVDLADTNPAAARGTGANSRQLIFAKHDVPAGKKETYTIEVIPRSAGEARMITQLFDDLRRAKDPEEKRESTPIVEQNNRSPAGPPPKIDPSKVGYPPG